MSIPAEKQERFHFLDGLRGIAALMIVFHHSFTSNIAAIFRHMNLPAVAYYFSYFTQSGVELFFVLSGIVLLRPYLRQQRKFDVGQYFFRRIKRIYPPYWAALLFGAGVSWYIYAFPTWYTHAVWHPFFLWWEVLKESVIINFDGGYYNLAWWSLGVEMFFYVLVPVVIFVFPKQHVLNNRKMIGAIIVTLVISISLQRWLTANCPVIYSYKRTTPNVYQFVCYPVCFLMGIFLAARDFSTRHAYILLLVGGVFVGFSWFYLPAANAGYGLAYGGLVILAFKADGFKRFLSKPIMIWLGERSYSLFLIHFSVFYLTDSVMAHFTSPKSASYALLTRCAGIPVALFAAMLLFHFVERRQARGLLTGNMFWPWQVRSLKI